MFVKKWKFITVYIIIFLIACYDAWWCFAIPETQFVNVEEQNPLVVWIIKHIGLESFIILKISCCALVILICEILRKIHTKIWKSVVFALLMVQLFVLFYLEYGHIFSFMINSSCNSWGYFWWKLYLAISKNY